MSTQLAPQATDPSPIVQRRLTQREVQVLELAQCGQSNKFIAGVLGVSPSTVATLLFRARKKSRDCPCAPAPSSHESAGAASKVADGGSTTYRTIRLSNVQALTPAEKAVIELALTGLSNTVIAEKRRSAMRTVANQLASAYSKLGIVSRRELRANAELIETELRKRRDV